MIRKLEQEDYKKVCGGKGKHWSEEEELSLMGLLCSHNFYTLSFADFEWDEAVEELNRMYGNNRSIKACRQRISWDKIQEALLQRKI